MILFASQHATIIGMGERALTSMTDYETYAMGEQALLKCPKALQVRLFDQIIYMNVVMTRQG